VLLPHAERLGTWLTPAAGEKRGLRLTALMKAEGLREPYLDSLLQQSGRIAEGGKPTTAATRMGSL